MQRKSFIKKSLAAFTAVNLLPVLNVFSGSSQIITRGSLSQTNITALPEVDAAFQKQFHALIEWLIRHGWAGYIKDITGADLKSNALDKELIRELNIEDVTGLDDFAGTRLIEPGQPSLSLLYHILASPRVSPFTQSDAYPELHQLDQLEDYIYSLQPLTIDALTANGCSLAVLAYEYRPGFKVPPFDPGHSLSQNKFADFVFSRTGVARIGTQSMHYDRKGRCFINQPLQKEKEKEIAVTPARYGLFLIELVTVEDTGIKLMNQQEVETVYDQDRYFIKPIRKICNSEAVSIQFSEYHLNEKLYQLANYKIAEKFVFDFSNYNTLEVPFKRINCSNDEGAELALHKNDRRMVALNRVGSSVLLASTPAELVSEAYQNNNRVVFKVPSFWKGKNQSNRRYSAFKVTSKKSKDDNDVFISDFVYRRSRITTRFNTPKNAPLFVNIKYQHENGSLKFLDNTKAEFASRIKEGNYEAQVYEDNICDGSIAAKIECKKFAGLNDAELVALSDKLTASCLSAFSLVTAPDFFPYIDGNDIRAYYYSGSFKVGRSKRNVTDEHFLEGGTINLSGIRQRANPKLVNPYTNGASFPGSHREDKAFDTVSAVVARYDQQNVKGRKKNQGPAFSFNYKRDYSQTSFLPDTCSGIFFPGWDSTYSGDNDNPYFSTSGLGSPFPEDMKLCAAANGMWPVASPDAGRTFQGSLETFPILGRPNTSIPLLDAELGLHPDSPYVSAFGYAATYGWDGEQGPYLTFINQLLCVNYTDINSADYIQNIRNPDIGFNMSLLRKLNTRQVIDRMDAMRKCIRTIEGGKVSATKKWLVVAAKVEQWETNNQCAGMPPQLCADSVQWGVRSNTALQGPGYLLVFADVEFSKKSREFVFPPKRKAKICKTISVC